MLDHHLPAIPRRQGQDYQVSFGDFQRLPGNEGEHLAGFGSGQQPLRDIRASAQPPLLPSRLVIQPRVLDGRRGRGSQRGQDRLILFVEVCALILFRQVQVAEYLIPDPDRHPQESLHGRVAVREPVRARMSGHVAQAERLGMRDQLAEQAAALGPVMDRRDLVLVQADRDERGQPAPFADDPQPAIAGIDQGHRRLDNPVQHRIQLKVGADRDDRLQQRTHPVPGRDHRRQPGLQFGQQVIQLQLRQQELPAGGFWDTDGSSPPLNTLRCYAPAGTSPLIRRVQGPGPAGWMPLRRRRHPA